MGLEVEIIRESAHREHEDKKVVERSGSIWAVSLRVRDASFLTEGEDFFWMFIHPFNWGRKFFFFRDQDLCYE